MLKRIPLALVGVAVWLTGSPAFATFHLMKVEQAIGGVGGDTTQQAVQLRMRASFQQFVMGSRLIVRDATGANPVTVIIFPTNVTNFAQGARILVVSPAFAAAQPAITADFQMTNLIPPSYLAAGRLTFEDSIGTVYWSLAWGGAGYTGSNTGAIDNDADGDYGPPFSGPLPSATTQALLFTTPDPTGSAPSTNNAADYAVTAGAATFTNNAGASGTVTGSPQADLAITKTDGQATAGAGSPLTYTITVSNAGPAAVTGATVTDSFPAALGGVTWTCTASAGSSCGSASGSGNINHTVSLLAGGTATFTATGTLDIGAFGTLSNTATVAAPGGVTDPTPGNNSATDVDVILPAADLSITKTDGVSSVSPGQVLTYTIVGGNAGPNPVTGATVADTVPATLTGATWTCTGAGGGTCTPGPVAGNINDTVNLPVGATVTYTLTATVSLTASSVSNTATITPPAVMSDPDPSDNSATDTDTVVCAGERVIVPDGRLSQATLPTGTTGFFGATVRIGGSYSVELENLTGTVPPGTLTVFAGDDGCTGTSSLMPNDTSAIDPAGTGGIARVSFAATGTQTFFRARLVNDTGAPVTFSVSWSDTTMFSPAWSDNGNFDTFYSFQNTTGATLHGALALLSPSGTVVIVHPLTIAPGQTASTNTAALGIPRNQVGTARFVHDGPPGAILAEAAIANFNLNPAYVQPVKFQAAREAAH